jgi:hypothetical protein
MRTATLFLGALALAAACSSGSGTSAAPGTTSSPSTTADPNLTPNSIPFVVGERIGLAGDWLVRVAAVNYPTSVPGLDPISTNERYVVIDLEMQYNGAAEHTVDVAKLFTLTDSSQQSHDVLAQPGRPNGIDGRYTRGTSHTGKLIFTAPKQQQLGLILYGLPIGSKVAYFAIDPPTVPEPE